MELTADTLTRLLAFAAIFVAMAAAEAALPRRRPAHGRARRWAANLAVAAIDTALLRLLFPAAAVGAALVAEGSGIGLLRGLPTWAAIPLAVVLLDLTIYWQHRLFHALPPLWRLHRMHHTDLDLDVTTALRFHPLEIALSMLIKLAAITLLGAPAAAVLAFEVLLNGAAMFNHANLQLPSAVDRWLRLLVVTPDMHRVHHSTEPAETDSNFGFNLPWWDRLFGTYRARPTRGHAGMSIGLAQFRDPSELQLGRMLLQPWIASGADGGRREPRSRA